jgi:2-C-methyl-D-erythritol 4-phosphate cytidylyltransferase
MAVVLIVAAGRGERLGAGRPKALVELAGRPLLDWSLAAFAGLEGVRATVVALPADAPAPPGVTAVQGGDSRSESVARALHASGRGDGREAIVVHDAARPLVTAALARRVLAALERDERADAAIAAMPMGDTLKRVRDGDGDGGVVSETVDRAGLWAVQTPQIFRREALQRALDVDERVLAQATDDAWLIERAGGRVIVVHAGAQNLKVTTPLDLELAATLLSTRGRTPPAA